MAAKKKKKKASAGPLLKVKEEGAIAGGKNRMYSGSIGSYEIGTVVAANKTAGKKKLLTLARKLLK